MADYSERIKSPYGFAVELKGDVGALESVARRHGCHQDVYTAITKIHFTTEALLDAFVEEQTTSDQLRLEVME